MEKIANTIAGIIGRAWEVFSFLLLFYVLFAGVAGLDNVGPSKTGYKYEVTDAGNLFKQIKNSPTEYEINGTAIEFKEPLTSNDLIDDHIDIIDKELTSRKDLEYLENKSKAQKDFDDWMLWKTVWYKFIVLIMTIIAAAITLPISKKIAQLTRWIFFGK